MHDWEIPFLIILAVLISSPFAVFVLFVALAIFTSLIDFVAFVIKDFISRFNSKED